MNIKITDFSDFRGSCYLYVDFRPDGIPFYIGIGTKRRVIRKERNELHRRICEKYEGCYREVIASGTRPEMTALEVQMISTFGRLDNQAGSLANLTDGGDGGTGRKVSDAEKTHMSALMGSKYRTDEMRKFWADSTKRLFTDSSVRAKHLIGVTVAWQSNEMRERHKANTTAAMAKPDVKARQKEGILKATSTPDYKEKRSVISKRVMNTPEVNSKLRASLKIAMNQPETKEKMRKILLDVHNRPEVIASKSAKSKRNHELKKRFIAATGYTGRYSKITLEMCELALKAPHCVTQSKNIGEVRHD